MDIPPVPKIPVNVRFPNRYTGGYDSSTVTDKLRWATIASVKKTRFNRNSDSGGINAIAKAAGFSQPQ
jgi:predicted PP-loop superfamily ATPase